MDELLTVRQLQELLRVDRITIYRMLNSGELPGFKVGSQWRFSRRQIEQWLQEQRASLETPALPGAADDLRPSPQSLPLSCVRAIQEIFAHALGVGAVITTADGAPLTPVANCCEFCELMLHSAEGRRRCLASRRAATAEAVGAPRVAACHAGLCIVTGRIEVQGQFVAAVHAGPYLEQPPDGKDWNIRMDELAAACSLDAQQLRQALDRVPALDAGRRQQLSRLFKQMVQTFSEIGEERFNLLGRLQRIAKISQLQ